MAFWNDKSYNFTNNWVTRALMAKPPSSIRCPVPRAEGPKIYWIPQGLYPTYNCVQLYIWSYFMEICNKLLWNQQITNRLTACDSRGGGSCSGPHVFHGTITVLSLWHHSSGPWDNGASIAMPCPEEWPLRSNVSGIWIRYSGDPL